TLALSLLSYTFWKRAIDVAASALGLGVLSPIFLAIALLVRASLGAPVPFRQTRPGLHARPFTTLKLRTMRDALDENGYPLTGGHLLDGNRLPWPGRLLRCTSLDELPELRNRLRGDMSLACPRPRLTDNHPLYSAEQARRHDVRPGITGWAQANGRNALG